MDIAVSMYLGGEEINATDSRLTSNSYRELGLKCAYCGEPVFHKNGDWNKAHFSHFPSMSSQKYEECLLRQRNVDKSSPSDESWWQPERQPQRHRLFQLHFFYILKSELPGIEIKDLYADLKDIDLDESEAQSLEIIARNKSKIGKYLKIFESDLLEIEIKIILEALDYITKTSSRNLLKAIAKYSAKKLINPRESVTVESCQNDFIDPIDLYCEIINSIKNISWLEVFTRITGAENRKMWDSISRTSTRKNKSFLRRIDDSRGRSGSYLFQRRTELWIANVEGFCLTSETRLAKIDDVLKMRASRWVVKKIKKPIFEAGDQNFFKFNYLKPEYRKDDIKGSLMPEVEEAVLVYLNLNPKNSPEISAFAGSGHNKKVCLDRSIHKLLETGTSNVLLYDKGQISPKVVARIRINKSAVKYQNYIFNDYVSFNENEYSPTKVSDIRVEEGIVDWLQELHSTLVKK